MRKDRMEHIIKVSQRQYLIDIKERTDLVSRHLIAFLTNGNEEDYTFLREFFHQVKGTSGTLELMDMSLIAQEIDGLLIEQKEKLTENPDLIANVVRLTGKLIALSEKKLSEADSDKSEKRISENLSLKGEILVMDNDLDSLNHLKKMLTAEGFDVHLSSNPEDILGYLEMETMDLAIIDNTLLKQSGLDSTKEIAAINSRTPILFMTGSDDSGYENEQRYIQKPVDRDQLFSAVNASLNDTNTTLKTSSKDESTKAYSRKEFVEFYEKEKENFQKNGEFFSVAFFDIDDFKSINESYGKQFADYLLLCFVEIIGEFLETESKVFRFGADEFLVLFPEMNGEEAKLTTDKIREELSSYPFKSTDNQTELILSFSSGIAEYTNSALNKTKLLEEADKALYVAKENGKNQTVIQNQSTAVSKNKILVVDDELLLANIIKTRLGYLGYEVDYAKDGQEALSKLSSNEYDLILLDIMLPKVTGIEVLKTFKDSHPKNDPKIIMISGKQSEATVMESLRLGADDFFKKPFSLDVLEHKIEKILTS